MENACATSIYVVVGIGAIALLFVSAFRFNKKELLKSMLLFIGILIAFVIPIREYVVWIFFVGRRGGPPLPWLIPGLVLIIVSFLLPAPPNQQEDDEETEL